MTAATLASETAAAAPALAASGAIDEVVAIADLRARVAAWKREGLRVGFVPTMGALHDGHLALVRQARTLADRVVVSIFVNPSQFAPHEDLDRYPRPLARDRALLAGVGCDLLFLPPVAAIYPEGFATWVEPGGAARGLEGEVRPHFFRGVATVVAKLFGMVQPDVAVFGQKDAQQLAVVRQLVRDLDLAVEIAAGETVREADGLALSSRNVYLDAEGRAAALVLSRAVAAGAEAIRAGERSADAVRATMRAVFAAEPRATLQYAEVVDAASFQPVATIAGTVVLPVAAVVGTTRLIDNAVVDLPVARA